MKKDGTTGTIISNRDTNPIIIQNLKESIMKKILPALAIASVTVFAACNTNDKTETELAVLKAKQATVDSMNQVVAEKESKAISYAAATSAARKSYASSAVRRSAPAKTVQYRSYSEPAVLPTATPAPAQKKGWSNKAKGAVIGGVVGAGAGAVISKDKKVQGAIIGGVLGAAGGYGIGAILDKKAGR